ncbi:PPIases accelerate the folding of proteins. It catalyzes the cis-trans isomerization of proline imidic peptide bonds in oligopeptides (By similarity) [Seminavis robusta]|uniref:PPIases accelerate the folding of proteins. It catalyzes the cis-trans isomerization of proline imidic peptide bonds in oligopeptides By similarity n=1 Tax=Seminavis robusta TaxID=568900 RepID=A0A9N8E1K3_9STRA|nr:PPIases accelerate the folding of proteins. It catalyzes the cis-trans isomerization of proline imidic peptide bonds in oligopeptides (By similarity) [Seminavis robusta]|eukprot:Sro440_g143500.1 PPIases accelerate the folding of proteins. It catalyzes the cis-trans isomerization of proline imidic peptide bonds in oligopeptides (By similarity) (309) ;mRNA; r:39208-40134
MVTVTPKQRSKKSSKTIVFATLAVVALVVIAVLSKGTSSSSLLRQTSKPLATAKTVQLSDTNNPQDTNKDPEISQKQQQHDECPYMSIHDLSEDERNPAKGERHMITPPRGGMIHLVCCQTTQGPFNTLVHEQWAPNGAKRFLEMVTTGYFNSKFGVPLMRCVQGFLCQFGLNSEPQLSKRFKETIPDDANWLPEGPKYRQNEEGVKRFATGYMAYAGGGKHTRDMQLIVSLDNIPTLAGGSPWEVPWGELVGQHSLDTFSKVYTGYGDNGPPQGDLWSRGITPADKEKFPKLDYVTGCAVVDQQIQE